MFIENMANYKKNLYITEKKNEAFEAQLSTYKREVKKSFSSRNWFKKLYAAK